MRPCLALLAVLFASASIVLANDPSSSALAKQSDSPAHRIPPLPAGKRYAYVTIHYEGTPRDADYILGLRTLVASIKNSGSKQDIVVLCSDNVSQSTRDLLHEDGAIVKIVQNVENPFKTDKNKRNKYQAHFEYTMNKLYLWNMTEYERVIYMDEDNIALYNVDELFFCGHFCVVFLNPLFFHTGLMVVKPNTAKFNELYDKLMHRDSYSFDGADQGFLVAQFRHLEAAPLFDPTKGPSEEPMERLSLGYNFNHVYHYPFFAWDTHRWNPRFRDLPVPVMTIGYPITQFLKPWCWWPSIFFDLHYLWQQQRATVTHDPFDGLWVLSRLLIIAAVYSGSLWVLHFLSTQASRFTVLPRKLVTACSVTIGPVASGSIAGLAAILIPQIFFINKMLPQLAPPMKAYPLFILYANVCIFVCLCFFALLHSVSFPRPLYMGFVPVPNSNAPVFNMMIPSILLYFFTWFCGFLPIYNSFVPKIIALFVTACLCVLNQINMFVTVARNGVRDVKANFSHKT